MGSNPASKSHMTNDLNLALSCNATHVKKLFNLWALWQDICSYLHVNVIVLKYLQV